MSYKGKLFRDPVHGYIEVPDEWCQKFVDTEVFQRLRFIEQSSMRMLFPAARHDRFIHSLGVYSIAKRVYAAIEYRIHEAFPDNEELCKRFKDTFLVAALLHDCAHSPFSHTGEELARKYCPSIESKLVNAIGSDNFRFDFYRSDTSKYATHELASAYVGCKTFEPVFGDAIDKEQFARMITGIKNRKDDSKEKRAYNCLISLINGFIVDVDRLDYLQRDTWATGICNASVDVERLISGIDVNVEKGRVCIKHTSLSCIVNAVAARDYIFQWVITNHIVSYANEILKRAMEDLIKALSTSGASDIDVGEMLFSPDRLIQGGEVVICGEKIFMPTDGDFLYLMKKYIPHSEYFKAYSRRDKTHISLWKTHAEFANLFMSILEPRFEKSFYDVNFWNMFAEKLEEFSKENPFCICTEPHPIKTTRHGICKVDANIEESYSRSILGKENLDLTYVFGSLGKEIRYNFNAFVNAKESESNRSLAKSTIEKLQSLFKDTIEEFNNP